MKLLLSALIYTALTLGANAADIAALRDGDMKKLVIHETPVEVSQAVFTTPAARNTAWPTGRANTCC